jgi:hypothetical protein
VIADAIAWPNQPLDGIKTEFNGITQTTAERKWVQECSIRRAFVVPRVCDDIFLDRHCRVTCCHSVAQRVKPELVRAFPPDCNRVRVHGATWWVGGWVGGCQGGWVGGCRVGGWVGEDDVTVCTFSYASERAQIFIIAKTA